MRHMKLKVAKKQFIDSNKNNWEWDETTETLQALSVLHGVSFKTATPPLTRPR
jgi:hypothetical protein